MISQKFDVPYGQIIDVTNGIKFRFFLDKEITLWYGDRTSTLREDLKMYNQLQRALEEMADLGVEGMKKTTGFVATTMLRDTLVKDHGMDKALASTLTINMDITLPSYLDHSEILPLVIPFAKTVNNLVSAFLTEGYSQDDVVSLGRQLSLKLDA